MENVAEQDIVTGDSNLNVQEGMIGMGLGSTMQTVLIQCSPSIFKVFCNISHWFSK